MALETFTSISILMIISAIMGALATKTRQPLVVAYIVSGVICGPCLEKRIVVDKKNFFIDGGEDCYINKREAYWL